MRNIKSYIFATVALAATSSSAFAHHETATEASTVYALAWVAAGAFALLALGFHARRKEQKAS